MALSFEESKKQLAKQAAAPMMYTAMPAMNEDIMTLDAGDVGLVAAYSEWTKSDKYDWYDEYVDDRVSRVDENKNITVDASQINISQEENSQYIPFEMPRYYDGFDLMEAELWFYYKCSDGHVEPSRAINVSYDTSTIKLGWLVDGKATHIAGDLKFEIRAIGVNSKGNAYIWKSKTFDKMTVLQSLIDDRIVELDDSWVQELVTRVAESVAEQVAEAQIADQVVAAENAATRAETAASNAEGAVSAALNGYATEVYVQEQIDSIPETDLSDYALKTEIPTVVSDLANDAGYITEHQSLEGYATETYVDDAVKAVDVSGQLVDYALKSELPSVEGLASEKYVDDAVAAVDVSDQLGDLSDAEGGARTVKQYVDDSVSAVDVSGQLVDYAKSADVNSQISGLETSISANKSGIETLSSKVSANETNIGNLTSNASTLSTKITDLELAVKDMTDQAGYEYYATYGKTTLAATGEESDNVFTLYEVDGESESVKSQFVITGGSGGGGASATTLTVTRITQSPLTITTSDKAIIECNCTSYDADGETVDCSYTWKKGSSIIMSGPIAQGLNTFDLTEYVTTGTHKFTLTVTDEGGSMSVKTWTVQMVDVRIESTFSDRITYAAGEPVSFTYTPYGAISKVVHFKLDGVELDPVTTTASGLLQSYTLPAQTHGAHLLESWITATVNNVDIETPHIYKDIIWYDEGSDVPVIGCIYRYDHYGVVAARQYNATDITYVVYDPSAENPTVTRYVDGEFIGTQTLNGTSDTWSYKSSEIGEKILAIECGDISVEIRLDVAELGINIEPVTANMAFDFNPTGRSNNDEDRIWSDVTTGITMSVSDNFDWTNGGYQRDDDGDTYFCVKAGTTAIINYNLFGSDYDPRANGKEFKFVFKTTNVKKRSSTFLSCIDGETPIGIDMKVENAKIYASNKELYIPYCEEDIIEFEFNINKDADIPMVMTYEDGVANRPLIYASDSSFMQIEAQPITIGSTDCDVHVYRMKAYDTSLTDKEILTNFIADARNADEMISRYNRNQIYDENNALTPETLAEKCPDLRIIMIDAPWFTNDKDDKVGGTTVRQIYKGGDAVLDNWTCTGAKHSGQGTSSNKYGYAGRNLRLIMNEDESLFTFNGTNEDGTPITGKEVTLTRDSVPSAFYNIKVNIASSENQNNAQFARRYNEFNPVVRSAKVNNPNVKDTMEFYNCVVFIRENEEDLTKHREFNDTLWHFYAIGNIGDDKKTDKSRMNNAKDPKECVVEIMDFDVPLAEFPTGIGGRYIAPEDFKTGNTAYDNLYSEYTYDEDGKFKGFGAESYEFRYEMKGITDEQRQANIDAWREFYTFVVTSTDEEFVENFENYFVLDSALYYYLFTERYLMVDNRAKNSFWHYGKCDDGVYRWDLCFGYDFDTSLGIDNTGKLILTYGQEDVDKDASGAYIYRAAESNFFCKIRDLFADRLKGMFQSRESLGAWSSTSLINQWDKAQSEFPEELWRLDVERKYIRTYRGVSIDNSIAGAENPMFLEPMLNGRKKYQRRQFDRNQELYMATKYVSTFAKDDFIRLRFNNPTNPVVKQDYTLYLTPYTDMYISAEFGNTAPIVFRAKAGVEYPVKRDAESDTADIVLIYGASFIQAIGDLSKCYLGDNDFSKATRLQSLTIGSNVAGYENTFMTGLALGNNKLLEYLDIRQITGLNSVVDLSQCNNLIELRAEGSGATGVIFANGGKVQKAYIPAVTSLTMKNLNELKVLDVESYSKLQKLIAENIYGIDTHTIVDAATALNTVRLVGIDWNNGFNIQDTSILHRMYGMRGVDNNGYENNKSVVTGYIWVASGKDREISEFNELWPYLTIEADAVTQQFKVTFVNDDGTVLDEQYVDAGTLPDDPIDRAENPIDTPTKDSTISTNYNFAGWDTTFKAVWSDQVITAIYDETTREYTVKYVSNNSVLQTSVALYGSTVSYDGEIPTYTAGEGSFKYYLFDRWDKSGYVDGDKTINAVFDSCFYSDKYFDGKKLSDLRPVEIYMMTKLGLVDQYVNPGDNLEISFGSDFDYSDLSGDKVNTIISSPRTFTGASGDYLNTGINLFEEDRGFVLAIEYNVTAGDTIAQCYSNDAFGGGIRGFRIRKTDSFVKCDVGTMSSSNISNANSREIVVIRHVKGENALHIYSSNTSSNAIVYNNIKVDGEMDHNRPLVFGCYLDNGDNKSQYGAGTIYWSKVWYADLGDSVCRELACWPHETLKLSACYDAMDEFGNQSAKTYLLSDGSYKRSSISFIASNALTSPKQYNSQSGNDGGWATSSLREYLNSRIYNAIPLKWRQLLKNVVVSSTEGNGSNTITSSNCYVFAPSISEIYPAINYAPYVNEGTIISHMTLASNRKCYNASGTSVTYWTRSPYTGSSGIYIYTIDTNGGSKEINSSTSLSTYVRIMFTI